MNTGNEIPRYRCNQYSKLFYRVRLMRKEKRAFARWEMGEIFLCFSFLDFLYRTSNFTMVIRCVPVLTAYEILCPLNFE